MTLIVPSPFVPRLFGQTFDPFLDWLIKQGALGQLGVTGLVYLIVVFAIVVLWRRIIPFYVNVRWPAEMAIREKRALAEIKAKEMEAENSRLMRDAIDALRNLQGQMMLLLDQHDTSARAGIDSIERLLAVVLEKQGLQPSEVQRLIDASTRDQVALSEAAKKLIELLPKPGASVAPAEARSS